MFSLEQIFLRRAVTRMRAHLEQGDRSAARAEIESFVARFPKSAPGWATLQQLIDSDQSTFEEWLDVRRRAAAAIPYDVHLVDSAIRASQFLFLKIGDRRYLSEAVALVDAFEALLGESAETAVWRATCSQLGGDPEATMVSLDRAEGFLARSPDPRLALDMGLCLASEPGQEERGLRIAEEAAERLKNPNVYLLLVAIVEQDDPTRAQGLRARADQLAGTNRNTPQRSDIALDGFREQVRLEREFLKSLRKGPA